MDAIKEAMIRADDREKLARNARVRVRYDELMTEGKHGHYETLCRIVREEVERATSGG